MDSKNIFFLINFIMLISGSGGIVISILLYLKNRNSIIRTYFWALLFWTLSQVVYHIFYYLNEVIHYSSLLVDLILNDLTFLFIAPFVYLLMILIHEIFQVKMEKGAILATKISMTFLGFPVMVFKYFIPGLTTIITFAEMVKGIGFYFLLYFIAFDINRHLSLILNDDIRKIFRGIFILQMFFYPLMIVESIFFFEKIYPFGISMLTLFYAVVNVLWLYFVSRYLYLPEIRLVAEDNDTELVNYFTIYKLTKREREVSKLLLSGLSYEQIGNQLFITLETVKSHVNNIYKKSGVSSKIELSNLVQKCKNS